MNEKERSRLFNIAIISSMALIFAGFLHVLTVSPQGSAAALMPLISELEEKNALAAKSCAALRKEKDDFKSGALYFKNYFKSSFAAKDVELIQGLIATLAKETGCEHFSAEYSLKKIYFIEALEVKAGFRSVAASAFLNFIESARAKFHLAPKMISMNELDEKKADIAFDFYIPFSAFKIRDLIEGNL
ncbi:MAG TPA: hypothetical protein PKW98_06725 [Candidatus Wallbacteria bacterium]|nr:MAG: hypothetical protein BWY32_00990 [bacterium ADurb.Bin243]HOD41657.1 hypothetical protein [Candidatus Wallbacteria bacterium]HPG57492.1 hypothetical protein [Candidatus Wallbacteria bacterium]